MGNTLKSIPVVGLFVPLVDAIKGDKDKARADFAANLNSTIVTGVTFLGEVVGALGGGPPGAMIGGMIGGAIGGAIGNITEAAMAKTVNDPKLRSQMADFSVKSFTMNMGFGAVGGAIGGGLGGVLADEVGWAGFKQFATGGTKNLLANNFRQTYVKKYLFTKSLGFAFSGFPKSMITKGSEQSQNNKLKAGVTANLNAHHVGLASIDSIQKILSDDDEKNDAELSGIIAGSCGVFFNQSQQTFLAIQSNKVIQSPLMSINTKWTIRYNTGTLNTFAIQSTKENNYVYLSCNDDKLTTSQKLDKTTLLKLESIDDGKSVIKSVNLNKYIYASSDKDGTFGFIDKATTNCTFDVQLNGLQLFSTKNLCEIFADVDFNGDTKAVVNHNTDLTKAGFNDKVSSVTVYTGIWFLYKDVNFSGTSYVKTRGNYNSLPDNGKLSSLRSIPDSNQFTNPLIVLFQDKDFGGEMMICVGGIDSLVPYKFNNNVSSIYVVSGTWALYQDVDFGGYQHLLVEGSYPDITKLGIPNDTISSLQEISLFGDCVLYKDVDLKGESIRVATKVSALSTLNFNVTASSMNITRGLWFCYSDNNYSGNVYIKGPGDYNTLPNNDTLSSLRVFPDKIEYTDQESKRDDDEKDNDDTNKAIQSTAGYENLSLDDPSYRAPLMVCFEDVNYGGKCVVINGNAPNLITTNWNDKISSIYVISGTWIVYKDVYYLGKYSILKEGGYANSDKIGLPNGSISSMQPAAMLGETVLYQDVDFTGTELSVYGAVPDLAKVSFNDTASSLKVNSGIWFLYKDVGFKGSCYIKERGDYSSLPDNDTLSSLRAIPDADMYNGQLLAAFKDTNYGDAILLIVDDMPNLIDYGWNDQISSIVVTGNTSFAVYEDVEYGGIMHIVPPGRYADIEKDLGIKNDSISSIRPITTIGQVTLYQDTNYGANQLNVVDKISNLDDFKFNDEVSSAKIQKGVWFMYKDVNFTYNSTNYVLKPGDHATLPVNDTLSSLRSVPDINMLPQFTSCCVVFKDANFGGDMLVICHDIPNLVNLGWNDVISSIYIVKGKWIFYKDVNFKGDYKIYGPGEIRYVGSDLNDQFSSVRSGDFLGQCTIYQDVNYGGSSRNVIEKVSNLANIGFNNTVSSIKLDSGIWLLYKNAYFDSLIEVITDSKGQLSQNDQLSSLRSIPDDKTLQSMDSKSLIAVFAEKNYEKAFHMSIADNVDSLERMGWFSFVNSLVIVGTLTWIVYEEENYQGKSQELTAGFYKDLSKLDVDAISSFKLKSS